VIEKRTESVMAFYKGSGDFYLGYITLKVICSYHSLLYYNNNNSSTVVILKLKLLVQGIQADFICYVTLLCPVTQVLLCPRSLGGALSDDAVQRLSVCHVHQA